MAEEEEQRTEGEEINQKPEDSEKVTLWKRAQKKLLKQQRWEAKKAEKKAQMKELKSKEKDRKRLEWEEKLSLLSEEEKLELIESRKCIRKERIAKVSEEREKKIQRLNHAKLHGQNVVIDFEFSDLMTPVEINSLSQQLTGCTGEIEAKLSKVPGIGNWIISKETTSYIEALQDRKDKLVYLTADAETVLDDLDLNDFYIIGGLVDRNRWKGITLKKAQEQGIRAAKLPIESYLKLSSSQVLAVNQVVEILLKYLETRDWKASFFQVIPQRKRGGSGTDKNKREEGEDEESEDKADSEAPIHTIKFFSSKYGLFTAREIGVGKHLTNFNTTPNPARTIYRHRLSVSPTPQVVSFERRSLSCIWRDRTDPIAKAGCFGNIGHLRIKTTSFYDLKTLNKTL